MSAQLELVLLKPMGRQLGLVYEAMSHKPGWWTFADLQRYLHARGVGASEAGISARIRELRKPCYGGFIVEKWPTSRKGIWAYRLLR